MIGDILLRVQRFITAYLRLDAGLEDVHVMPSRTEPAEDGVETGMVNDAIEEALAGLRDKNGKSGAAIIVMMPDVAPEDPNLPGPQMELEVAVRVVENRIINEGDAGTGLSAPRLAVHVARLLHHWAPDGSNVLRPARRLIQDISVPDREMHEVRFLMRLPVAAEERTGTPLLAGEEGEAGVTVTMTCATAGAEIYYSLDGSFPSELYEEPLLLTEPAEILALATSSGRLASRMAKAQITPEITP